MKKWVWMCEEKINNSLYICSSRVFDEETNDQQQKDLFGNNCDFINSLKSFLSQFNFLRQFTDKAKVNDEAEKKHYSC